MRVTSVDPHGLRTDHGGTAVQIADLLQVSLDELAGRSGSITDPKIHNSELLNLYQQVDSLPDVSPQGKRLANPIGFPPHK